MTLPEILLAIADHDGAPFVNLFHYKQQVGIWHCSVSYDEERLEVMMATGLTPETAAQRMLNMLDDKRPKKWVSAFD